VKKTLGGTIMYEEKLEMRTLATIIGRRHKIVWGVLSVAIIAALLFSLLQPTQYEGTDSIRVQYPLGLNDRLSALPSDQMITQQIMTYAEIVKSRAVVQPVIDYLYADAEEKPLYEEWLNKSMRNRWPNRYAGAQHFGRFAGNGSKSRGLPVDDIQRETDGYCQVTGERIANLHRRTAGGSKEGTG
jgi:hypothetical protein